jgi:hypothetical protein
VALAEPSHRYSGGNFNGIQPSTTGSPAVCNTSDPQNWGEPLDPSGPCGLFFPVIHINGDARVQSGGSVQGQGILLVEGDLDVRGAFEFFGLVLVKGQFESQGSNGPVRAIQDHRRPRRRQWLREDGGGGPLRGSARGGPRCHAPPPARRHRGGEVMDPGLVADTIRSLFRGSGIAPGKDVVTAVGGHDVIVKKISMDRMKEPMPGRSSGGRRSSTSPSTSRAWSWTSRSWTPTRRGSRWRSSWWRRSGSWWTTRWPSSRSRPLPPSSTWTPSPSTTPSSGTTPRPCPASWRW